jgi:hypothetical protein
LAKGPDPGKFKRNSDRFHAAQVNHCCLEHRLRVFLLTATLFLSSLDVILRSEIVERAKAGDKCVFTGTFIVVPDVAALGLPGVNAEMMRESSGLGRGAGAMGPGAQGVSGLRALGVKDLTYKTAFLACMVQSADSRVRETRYNPETTANETYQAGGSNARSEGESSGAEASRQEFLASLTSQEIEELQAMVEGDHIYSRIIQSIAPTVYGQSISYLYIPLPRLLTYSIRVQATKSLKRASCSSLWVASTSRPWKGYICVATSMFA